MPSDKTVLAKELHHKLLSLQSEFAEDNSLWTILEDACAEVKKRIRRLELANKNALEMLEVPNGGAEI